MDGSTSSDEPHNGGAAPFTTAMAVAIATVSYGREVEPQARGPCSMGPGHHPTKGTRAAPTRWG